MPSQIHRQRGMVFLLFVVVLAVIGLTLVMGASALQAQDVWNRAGAEQQRYLDEAGRALRVWYQEHLATADREVAAPAMADILNRAGIGRRYGVQAAASARIAAGDVAYRVMVLWIPVATPDPSEFHADTGVFSPGPGVRYVRISGQDLQAEAVTRTRHVLSDLAMALENYFAARSGLIGHDVQTNVFRPDAACANGAGALPCLDTYTPATAIDWIGVGLGGVGVIDAWGNALELSNGQDAQSAAAPFSIALRAVTPFGTVLTLQAVQRL